ncbi:MAG: glucose-6-phosphate dehydrogenase [Brevinema sp.]
MSGTTNRNFTIFGGTGDLTYRKLLPALYNLYVEKSLGDDDHIIIIGRKEYDKEAYLNIIREWVSKYARVSFDISTFLGFTKLIEYYQMNFTQLEDYAPLAKHLKREKIKQNIFYFAVSPVFFPIISEGISSLKLADNPKLIIEKPFGETLEEAEKLNNSLIEHFGKDNIYRIDHYLGKEMVQSVQTIRFSNLLFKECWNNRCIEKVEIIAHEEVGVETRAGYYDKTGALKDMVQNHLMQILSLIAMEEPDDKFPIKIRQQQVFESLRPIEKVDIKKSLMLAQYEGYLQEAGVAPNSQTETYATCMIFVDNERWKDGPFYIKTGKRLASREMNVIITFKTIKNEEPDVLIFKIQPSEGVRIEFNIKQPGYSNDQTRAEMDFCQDCILAHRINTPEAYERLIQAVMNGDNSLFSTWEHISLSWDYVNKLKQKYINEKVSVQLYAQGSKSVDNIFQ